jgi:hypothetical protein
VTTHDAMMVTCGRGHRLVQIGPDPDASDVITVRWHDRPPNRWHTASWPVTGDPASTVHVACRCYRGFLSLVALSAAYDAGARGRLCLHRLLDNLRDL